MRQAIQELGPLNKYFYWEIRVIVQHFLLQVIVMFIFHIFLNL